MCGTSERLYGNIAFLMDINDPDLYGQHTTICKQYKSCSIVNDDEDPDRLQEDTEMLFVIVGYVDGVQFIKYDSDWKVLIPREQWMVESEGRKAWARKLYLAQLQELDFRAFVPRIMERINQTSGIYTYQMMTGCDLRGDVAMVGFNQYAWNGRDVLSFDREHMVWVSPVPWGESIKNRWDQDVLGNRQWKQYLEEECGTWLRKYLEYGQKELEVGERGR
eukprot:g43261.t1